MTLQPIQRFDLDAAIIFSDILTIPHALGHRVRFSVGYGPQVEKLTGPEQVAALGSRLADLPDTLANVGQTVRLTRRALAADKAVIGFTGAPWTLATYLFDNKPSGGCHGTLSFAKAHPEAFNDLIRILTEACVAYLLLQARAGASVLQVFDSWAGLCPPALQEVAVHTPLRAIAKALHDHAPDVPMVLFPRGLAPAALAKLVGTLPVRAGLSLDQATSLAWACDTLPAERVTLQGNLDPQLMTLNDPAPLAAAARHALATMQGRPYVMNLGHGLTPDTRIARVAQLVDIVRNGTAD